MCKKTKNTNGASGPQQAAFQFALSSVVANKVNIACAVGDPGTASRSGVHGQLQPLRRNRMKTLLRTKSIKSVLSPFLARR